jgi:hypothetical protein
MLMSRLEKRLLERLTHRKSVRTDGWQTRGRKGPHAVVGVNDVDGKVKEPISGMAITRKAQGIGMPVIGVRTNATKVYPILLGQTS